MSSLGRKCNGNRFTHLFVGRSIFSINQVVTAGVLLKEAADQVLPSDFILIFCVAPTHLFGGYSQQLMIKRLMDEP
jgi:hypothetical protein